MSHRGPSQAFHTRFVDEYVFLNDESSHILLNKQDEGVKMPISVTLINASGATMEIFEHQKGMGMSNMIVLAKTGEEN